MLGRRAIGYVSPGRETYPENDELVAQADAIERACHDRRLEVAVVLSDERASAGHGGRPALRRAFEAIAGGEASTLVVARLTSVAGSAAAVGAVVGWFEQGDARLIALDLGLDTGSPSGRLIARALTAAGELEHEKLGARTRAGLAAARSRGSASGRPAVADDPRLRLHILRRREEGLTLQAIADELNWADVPTLRGGTRWRPSSVQAAAGYRRPSRRRDNDLLPELRGLESPTDVRNGSVAYPL